MKKILVLLLTLFLTGCSNKTNPRIMTSEYLDGYKNLNQSIKDNLDKVINNLDYSDENKEKYKKLLERQYKNLTYEIVNQEYDSNNALVTVKIKVFDYATSAEKIENEAIKNIDKFYDKDENFKKDEYLSFKFDELNKVKEKVEYEIIFSFEYKDDKWVMAKPSDEDFEKIHGLFKNN